MPSKHAKEYAGTELKDRVAYHRNKIAHRKAFKSGVLDSLKKAIAPRQDKMIKFTKEAEGLATKAEKLADKLEKKESEAARVARELHNVHEELLKTVTKMRRG